jgi:hypothetical protein
MLCKAPALARRGQYVEIARSIGRRVGLGHAVQLRCAAVLRVSAAMSRQMTLMVAVPTLLALIAFQCGEDRSSDRAARANAAAAPPARKPIVVSHTREVLPGVRARVIVHLDPPSPEASDFASWPSSSTQRFGDYSLIVSGVSDGDRQLLFDECGLLVEPAAGHEPHASMTRLTSGVLKSFAQALEGRPYFDLDVEIAPARDLTWGEVRTKSDIAVSITAKDFGDPLAGETLAAGR